MMKTNNINEAAYFERMRQLADVDKKLTKEHKNSTLLDHKEAADGRVYGVIKEGGNYYIKTAIKKDNINEADFAYIGGLSNITEYKCKSLTDAQKILNTKVMTIDETYGYVKEDEVEQTPQPQPQPSPEPQPEQTPPPSPELPAEPQPEVSADDETINQVKSYVGKAGNLLTGAEIPSEKTKQIIKMFLGYFNIEGMSEEDKNEVARIFRSEEESVQEGFLNEVDEFMMTPESIGAIIAGVGAIFGGAYGVDKLMTYLKSKNPKLAKNLESMGKGSSSGIKGGTTSMEEGYDLVEDDELEDDILDAMPEEPMDTTDIMDTPMDVEVKSGEKKVSIDLNAGTVDVNLSESKITELAKKYNVSESYIKWKIRDIMNEEINASEKQKLKEEKVRNVVKNIIKEKLGLKKKPINESVSKERLKLEKLVESVLKKNIK